MGAETEIRALVEAWFAALQSPEDPSAWYQRHWAEEFVYVNSSGAAFSKDELLRLNASAERGDAAYRLRGVDRVSRHGDVALALGRYFGRSTYPVDAVVPNVVRMLAAVGVEERFTSCWAWRDGRWQCLVWHATAIFA
ncbi:MAG: nuclear transport factor 2 family protein [Solirubrobacteraceae bacterium]